MLGLAAPEEHGGEGLGLAELGVLVREAGARALDLPFRETLVCGLLTLVRCGTPDQQELFVPRIVSGDLLVAPALNEVGVALPERPSTRLEDDRLTGRKIAVPAYDEHPDATTLLMVSASDAAGEPGRRARRPGERRRHPQDGTELPRGRPRRPTSSTVRRSWACSPTEPPTCSASTWSPVRCCRVTDCCPARGT